MRFCLSGPFPKGGSEAKDIVVIDCPWQFNTLYQFKDGVPDTFQSGGGCSWGGNAAAVCVACLRRKDDEALLEEQ